MRHIPSFIQDLDAAWASLSAGALSNRPSLAETRSTRLTPSGLTPGPCCRHKSAPVLATSELQSPELLQSPRFSGSIPYLPDAQLEERNTGQTDMPAINTGTKDSFVPPPSHLAHHINNNQNTRPHLRRRASEMRVDFRQSSACQKTSSATSTRWHRTPGWGTVRLTLD